MIHSFHKKHYLCFPLQLWKVFIQSMAWCFNCRAGTHGLKEGLAVRPAAASKSFTDGQIPPHAASSTWPRGLLEKRFDQCPTWMSGARTARVQYQYHSAATQHVIALKKQTATFP